MAAATVSNKRVVSGATQDVVMEFRVSSMTSDQLETISHSGPSGVKPSSVEVQTVIEPTAGPISWAWIEASDDLTNDTMAMRFSVPAGGDITNGVVLVRVHFLSHKSGGKVT